MVRAFVRAVLWCVTAAAGCHGWVAASQPRVTVFEGFYHPG